ncbi:MAG: ribonuclease P protein component [Candidatus Cyclobacteriaceae bacterium M3_2C_046]
MTSDEKSGIKRTFSKSERLNNKDLIKELFSRGSSFFIYPFKVVYLPQPCQNFSYPTILISVSKKNFKKAVARNKIKRRIREAYRVNKYILAEKSPEKTAAVAFIYVSKDILDFASIESKLKLILLRLKKVL